MIEALLARFEFPADLTAAARAAAARVAGIERSGPQQAKAAVLRAFVDEGVNESDFTVALGYGYDDPARDRYESLLARLFGVERATGERVDGVCRWPRRSEEIGRVLPLDAPCSPSGR